jgi:hypothetical protein
MNLGGSWSFLNATTSDKKGAAGPAKSAGFRQDMKVKYV